MIASLDAGLKLPCDSPAAILSLTCVGVQRTCKVTATEKNFTEEKDILSDIFFGFFFACKLFGACALWVVYSTV